MTKPLCPFPALIFDLDGTLLDSLPDVIGALNRLLAEEGRDAASFPVSKRVYLAIDDDEQRALGRLKEWFGNYYGNADMAERVAEL